MSPLSHETSLFTRCQSGDDDAWTELVARYERLVYSTALEAGLEDDAAVDVFQQVWLELHRSLLRIRDPQALPRWLIVTTRRIAYRHAAVSRRWVSEVREDLADPAPRADSIIVALEERLAIEEALLTVGERCQRLLRMLFYSDRRASYREIADETGLSEDSIGSLRARCLDRLRAAMGLTT